MQQSAQAQAHAHAHAQSQARERGASTCLAHKTWLLPGGGGGVTSFTVRVGRYEPEEAPQEPQTDAEFEAPKQRRQRKSC